jgi:hypothetical protein
MDRSGTVGNSQCSVALANSSVTGSGNTLTVALDMSFNSSFGGYASEVLQNQSDLNQVGQSWVMMFREDKTNKLPGRGAEEQHDPEKG